MLRQIFNSVLTHIFGEGKPQQLMRIFIYACLILAMLYASYYYHSGLISKLVSFSALFVFYILINIFIKIIDIRLASNSSNTNAVLRMFHKVYMGNSYQKAWIDVFIFCIGLALFLPTVSCVWDISFQNSPNHNDISRSFLLWEAAAIIMSILLSIIYYVDFFKHHFELISEKYHMYSGLLALMAIIACLEPVAQTFSTPKASCTKILH